MQEISPNIFIETSYPGVTLAVIRCQRGLILIDAPLRLEDSRSWRSVLSAMNGGYERLLVVLDEHFDRTLGTRQMESISVGQDALNQALKDRPLSFKTQGQESGADWELVNNLGIVRWALPDISFTKRIDLYWDKFPIQLQTVPGPSHASIWVELPQQKIVFIGDTVIPNAPPFLAAADLPAWQEALNKLLSPTYKGYMLVSSRGGVITTNEVKDQAKFLGKVQQQLEKLEGKGMKDHEIESISLHLLKHFDSKSRHYEQFLSRLNYGLTHYLKAHPTSIIPK
jgi:glyoxylase-like metal-dependent hydrolase (beta-lactamase superfamily II)